MANDQRRIKYESKRIVKKISLNSETDTDLLDYLESVPDFSNFVKQLIRERLKKERKEV